MFVVTSAGDLACGGGGAKKAGTSSSILGDSERRSDYLIQGSARCKLVYLNASGSLS